MPVTFRSAIARGAVAGALAFVHAATCYANIGQDYGFGSRSAALGGAGVSYGFGGFAAYHNPAALPFDGAKRLIVDFGVILMDPSFTPIRDVVVENTYTSDKTTYSDVDDDYRATFGQQLGLVYRLFPETYNLTFGIAAFIPLQQVAYMDTGETFVPEYFMYRSRTQRPQVELGFGGDFGNGVKLGFGLHLAFALTSSATVFLQTDSAKPSTMRFASSLKPKIAPQLGFLYQPPSNPDAFSIGAVLRFPVSSPNNLFLKSGARAFGSFAALDFNFKATSALFYDPLSLELGGSISEGPNARTAVQLDYQRWSQFEAPALLIQDPKNESCGNSPCGVNISGGKNPAFDFRDIVVPRVGQELTFGTTTIRLGYAYRPTILKYLPTGPGNYLDPSKHIFTAGMGFRFNRFLSFDVPCNVDFNLAWHQLVSQTIVKAPGDENGATGTADSVKIGAPGYEAGGKIYGGGVDLTLAF